MNKKFAIHAFAVFAMAASLQVPDLQAMPALPGIMVMPLPDGAEISVQLHGDEYLHWYTTSDGYPLVRQADGFFYYAGMSGSGDLVATDVRAADADRRTDAEKTMLSRMDKESAVRALSERRAVKAARHPMKIMGETTYPTTGSHRSLALLVEFPKVGDDGKAVEFCYDNVHGLFQDMLNKRGFDFEGATGSVADYYRDCSSGQFDLAFDVYGPVTVSNDVSYYGVDEEAHAWEMVVEACTALDGEIDFSRYDEDHDGVIDNVYVFYAGQGEADGGPGWTIWPHAGDLDLLAKGQQFLFDGVRLNHYACSCEIRVMMNADEQRRETRFEGIGNVCHEFTHVLGFPDLYNTVDQGASFTPGSWSLMDTGAYNNYGRTPPMYSAYERMSMGWLTPQTLDAPDNIILDALSGNKACRINTPNAEEIFILENRQQDGWDRYLPGHGMLVWHIAYEPERWKYNQVNTVNGYQCIDIEEADNIWSENSRAGDVFPGTAGVTEFTDDTQPGMLTLSGQKPCEIPITEIEERNGLIHFKVKGGRVAAAPVTALPATDVTPLSFTANWEPGPDATGYKLDVWRQNGMNIDYVDGYRARLVDGTSCMVDGLVPETTYIYTVRAVADGSESPASNRIEVTTGVATFEYIAPVETEPTGVSATEFTANWLPLDGADGYLIDVYTKEKGDADIESVDFTGGVKQLPEGWRTDCQMTVSMGGYYGESAPALSMQTDYNYVESPMFDDDVRGVRFWYRERNNPTGDNRIEVSTLVGTSWVSVETVALPLPAAAGTTVEIGEDKIPQGSRAVRIVYRQTGSGALSIDDVAVAYNNNFRSVALPGWEAHDTGNVTSVTVGGLQPLTDYYYVLRGRKGTLITIPSAETCVTTSDSASAEGAEVGAGFRITRIGDCLAVDCGSSEGIFVELYTADGRLLARKESGGGTVATLPLPESGVYVIKIGGRSCKIAL